MLKADCEPLTRSAARAVLHLVRVRGRVRDRVRVRVWVRVRVRLRFEGGAPQL